jgi:chromosome partitioning protein
MADIICVIGNKGGTGKTTLSHMLCHGMGGLGQRSVCVLTDSDREPLDPKGRSYLALAKVTDKIRSLPAWMGVIDGGGNRTELDRRLYSLADLVLLPFRDSHEDLRTVVRDLELFPRAYAIPSQWPTLPWLREAADRMVAEHLDGYLDRILPPIPALAVSKQLLERNLPAVVPAPLGNACRDFARQVLELLQVPYETVPMGNLANRSTVPPLRPVALAAA